jgi:phosphatidylglycerol:prolipoprotein diacylglycerol transferase
VSTYSENWIGALRIWEGGLSFHGAFLGGLLVLGVFTLAQRRREEPHSLWELADVVTLGIALGLAFGWAGCFLRGCAYGIPGEGFGYASLPDIYGIEANRFAIQAFGLGVALVLTLVFWLLRKRWPFSGASFLMLVLLTFASQFFLESKRYDEAIYVGPWRLQQVLDLALALAAAVGLLVLWWQARGDEGEVEAVEEAARTEEEEEAVQGEDLAGAALQVAQAEEGEEAIPVEEPAQADRGEEAGEAEDEEEAG